MPAKPRTKAARKTSGPALTRQRHRERGEEQLAVWLPAGLVAAVREMADRQGTSTTQLVGLLLMRAVTEAAIRDGGSLPFDLLAAGDLGSSETPRVRPPSLSTAARAARAPLKPEELVGALQDRIHPTSGRLLAAKPIATTRRK